MEIKQYLDDFYKNVCDEDKRLTLRHNSLEFITTMHYIEQYLNPGNRVIEIGAGTGRYSHAIAQKSYAVDAIELVEHNIEIFRQNIHPGENVSVRQGDALDLSEFPDNTYDITLLLGPMYHLFSKEDKQKAMDEAIRITKKGGIVFAAYCISDTTILVSGFKEKKFSVAEFMEQGLIEPQTFVVHSKPELLFEIVRKEDIDDLMSMFPVTRLHYVATDGYAFHIQETIDEMDDREFDLFLQYHLATCERGDMVGLTAHSLDIFRK